jgi:hypothetical protein
MLAAAPGASDELRVTEGSAFSVFFLPSVSSPLSSRIIVKKRHYDMSRYFDR